MSTGRYYWLNEDSISFLKRGYLEPGVEPEERIHQIATYAEGILGIEGFAKKFEDYMSRGFYSLATPVWLNYGLNRGLGISCFGITIQDELPDIFRSIGEIGTMTSQGGGTAGYIGNLRHRGAPISNGGTSGGSVHFLEAFQAMTSVVTQGEARRGHFAAYLPIEHPDIEEFLQCRTEGHPIQTLSTAVSVKDEWMNEMIAGDVNKQKIWAKILQRRSETGYPFIFFHDNVNKAKPQVYKDKDLEIKHSQMCTEIMEYTDNEKSFTCCLSSINLVHIDEILQTDAIETLTYFLDSVLTDFINKASKKPFMEKAVKFAKEHRSIGLGVLGWHSYLQSKMIPFEGLESRLLNLFIFKAINERSLKASKDLAVKYGEPEILKGYGERFSTRLAIAPTTSSSFILGQVSPSIEPLAGNYFIKDLAKGKFTYKNPYLVEVLKGYGKDEPEVWKSIAKKGGSVQHLEFLTQEERNVFKTFSEVSQLEVVQQAAGRQLYIDQGQSLNLMIHPEVSVKEINKLIIEAWKLGIKTLYYQRSANLAQEVSREINNCVSCES
jgi:ribonucleoside-diphosphate reductase alpha chain